MKREKQQNYKQNWYIFLAMVYRCMMSWTNLEVVEDEECLSYPAWWHVAHHLKWHDIMWFSNFGGCMDDRCHDIYKKTIQPHGTVFEQRWSYNLGGGILKGVSLRTKQLAGMSKQDKQSWHRWELQYRLIAYCWAHLILRKKSECCSSACACRTTN